MRAWAAVIWRLDGGWIICFQDGSLTWLLSGGLSSSSCSTNEASTRGLSINWTWQLVSTRARDPTERKGKPHAFLWTSLRNHISSLLPYSVGHTDPPWCGEGGDATRTRMPVGRDPWRPSWRLAVTESLSNLAFKQRDWASLKLPTAPCSMGGGLGVTFTQANDSVIYVFPTLLKKMEKCWLLFFRIWENDHFRLLLVEVWSKCKLFLYFDSTTLLLRLLSSVLSILSI